MKTVQVTAHFNDGRVRSLIVSEAVGRKLDRKALSKETVSEQDVNGVPFTIDFSRVDQFKSG